MNVFILFEKKNPPKVTFVIFVFIEQTQISIKNLIRQQKISVSGFKKHHLHDIPCFYPNIYF